MAKKNDLRAMLVSVVTIKGLGSMGKGKKKLKRIV